MKINNIMNNVVPFRNNQSRQEKYRYILEKRAYIDSKTDALSDFSTSTLILSLLFGVQNIDLSKKMKTIQKWGLGFLIVSIGTFIATCIRKIQLSDDFDKGE